MLNNIIRTSEISSYSENDCDECQQQICVLGEGNSIMSNVSPNDSEIQFNLDSFSFHYVDNSYLIIKLNPIFLWKLVKRMKTVSSTEYELDFIRIQTFISHYMNGMNDDIKIHVYEDNVSFTRNGIVNSIETDKYFPTLLSAYNNLYIDIIRKYNELEKTIEIINECSDIIEFISNPTFDKREHHI